MNYNYITVNRRSINYDYIHTEIATKGIRMTERGHYLFLNQQIRNSKKKIHWGRIGTTQRSFSIYF